MAVRIDSLSGLFVAAISTYVVYGGKIDAGLAGFTITILMSFSKDIVWWARVFNMLEIQGKKAMDVSIRFLIVLISYELGEGPWLHAD